MVSAGTAVVTTHVDRCHHSCHHTGSVLDTWSPTSYGGYYKVASSIQIQNTTQQTFECKHVAKIVWDFTESAGSSILTCLLFIWRVFSQHEIWTQNRLVLVLETGEKQN